MRIKEIMESQDRSDGSVLYLFKQGLFYHAINQAAFYLSTLTGYQVRTRYLPDGTQYSLLGFPVSSLSKVLNLCTANDIKVTDKTIKLTFKTDIK